MDMIEAKAPAFEHGLTQTVLSSFVALATLNCTLSLMLHAPLSIWTRIPHEAGIAESMCSRSKPGFIRAYTIVHSIHVQD